MTEGDPEEPLRALQRRIEGAQRALEAGTKKRAPRKDAGSFGTALAFAWRIGIELVVAIAVSTALGWAIDRWAGTRPWGMIVMFFLGVAAGMVNVWRAVAGMGAGVGFRDGKAAPAAPDRADDED
jgi:ATP synthase protein I